MTTETHIHRRLPGTETYACSKNEAKEAFDDLPGLVVHFGEETHFEYPKGVHHPPELGGPVVASVTVDREGDVSLCFFPLKKSDYADHEHRTFVQNELSGIRQWIETAQAMPETQVVSNRLLIVESHVDGFNQFEVHFA